MNIVNFPGGEARPALGLGTWRMGESAGSRGAEVTAIRRAIEIGYRVFDTAEMYGEGGAEEVLGQGLGEALRAGDVARDALFVVSKVYPHNASRAGTRAACERSRARLGLGHIDLYLLHWRGGHPLGDTIAGFEDLERAGHIHRWGVSNFDARELAELAALRGGRDCACNQVYYSLGERGIEFDLLPWQREHAVPLMAYCPLDQGRLAGDATLAAIAQRHDAGAAQVALAWMLAQPGVLAIPKAVREAHLRENFAAASLRLTDVDLREIDARFPPPLQKVPLAMS